MIENGSDNTYTITEVRKPCTCTDVKLSVGTRIDPHSRFEIVGGLNSTGKRGASSSSILIAYRPVDDGKEQSNAKFTLPVPLLVDVRPSIEVPREAIRLKADGWTTVDLKAGTESTFKIRRIATSDPFIRYEVDDGALGVPTDSFRIRLSLDTKRIDPSLPLDGDFWIELETSAPGDPSIKLPVFLPPSPLLERRSER
jgi:hypothetical protein